MRTWAATVAVLALAAAPTAAAQFTAALVPAHLPSPRSVLTANSNARTAMPSGTRVDSSLGAFDSTFFDSSSNSVTATEKTTSTPPRAASTVHSPDTISGGDTVFSDGASAPETDSTLPALALAGVGTLLVGVVLVRR
ncbi:MAG TPA: hypothetical protein VGR59_07375 [Gemmatimonadaceae bacterium]|nr:hypothetical protein [Gemmatimonadaceae bacterium]